MAVMARSPQSRAPAERGAARPVLSEMTTVTTAAALDLTSVEHAHALDARDPLAAYRDRYAPTGDRYYLAGPTLGRVDWDALTGWYHRLGFLPHLPEDDELHTGSLLRQPRGENQ